MQERRSSPLSNDLLLQILENQVESAKTTAETKALVESLAGEHGRVTQLEKSQVRQWWLTIAIGPILGVAHGVARKLGANF